jgi:hypothetical protein
MRNGPSRGTATVSVDGHVVATVSLRASATGSARIVFERSWSAVGNHTIRIRVSGTTGHPRVDLDGFVVLGPG